MTNNNFVLARNTVSGVVGLVPASYLDHPVFKEHLVAVDEGAKDFVPALYQPKTAEEFKAAKTAKSNSGDETASDGTTDNKER